MDSLLPALPIDVVSDVVCPWCYLGRRRLAEALSMVGPVPVAIRWRPYRLDPTIPPGGIERREYIERKFGSLTALDTAHANLVALGTAEGIDFRFERITRSPNTIDAHRLVRWASAIGAEDAAVEALFRGYFTEGRDIGEHAVLADIAGTVGLDPSKTAARLATDEDRAIVEAEIALAYKIGVTGVPCFILGQRHGVVGAQPAEVLARAIAEHLPK